MKKYFVLLIFLSLCAQAKHTFPEKYYQNKWCTTNNGQAEYRLADNTRVDCLTKNYAVEFDFAPKWAESIGQSLYYAKLTNKKPGIILIMEKPSDYIYFNRAKILANDYGIKLWTMKSPEYSTTIVQTKK